MTGEPSEISSQSFEKLSPQEKCATLKNFYLQSLISVSPPEAMFEISPRTTMAEYLQYSEKLARKDKSEIKKIFLARLHKFLEPANITEGMKEYIIWDYDIRILRFSTGQAKDRDLPEWLDRKDAGIYSEDKAIVKDIEKLHYKVFSRSISEFHQTFGGLMSRLHGLSMDAAKLLGDQDRIIDQQGVEKQIVSHWRQDYLNRYGDEP